MKIKIIDEAKINDVKIARHIFGFSFLFFGFLRFVWLVEKNK